jgi:plastocyanin
VRRDSGWRIVAAVAAVVTLACGVFAVVAAATSDDGGTSTSAEQPGSGGGGQQVTIRDFAFDPPSLTVAAGSTVTWTNDDDATHNLRSDDDVIKSADLDRGDTTSVTFDQPGTYAYFCGIHNFMTATITVTG